MKLKLILSVMAVCFLSNTSNAQIESLEGIGKFKLKKTTSSIIKDLATELNLKIETIKNHDDEYNKTTGTRNVIAELIADSVSTDKSPYRASHCKATKVFYIKQYTIANIKIDNIYLTFYNDTLVNFESDASSELVDAMNTKYGEAELDVKDKESSCHIGGKKISVKETIGIRNWKNTTISAKTYSMKYYNSECKERFIFSFEITCGNYPSILKNCNDTEKEAIEKKQKEEKKKGLSDF